MPKKYLQNEQSNHFKRLFLGFVLGLEDHAVKLFC